MCDVEPPVRRRHVFFFSGFDPKGASYYHRIYREQAAQQGAITGVDYAVGPRMKTPQGNTRWTVRATPCDATQGSPVDTTYEYLRWDDIVRAQWPRGAGGVLKESLRTYRAAVWPALRAWPVAPKTVMSLFYPALYWVMALLLGVVLAGLVGRSLSPLVGTLWGPLLGLAGGAGVLAAAWWLERRLHTSWLLRIFSFAHAWAIDRVPGLQARLDSAARLIGEQLQQPDVDEVLVVGFSVGSMFAVSTAARTAQALASAPEPLHKLSVLTLGHCVPLLGLMPEADAFRRELQRVGAHAALCWVDVSAPGDWGSFALVDPVPLCRPGARVGEQVAEPMAVNPRSVLSPRFHTLFDAADYQILKKDKRRMHMQYLMAAQRPGVYDYFALTAGPLALRRRLALGRVS